MEHIVVLPEGGPAIKVRTIRRMASADRWNPDIIAEIEATPSMPNPNSLTQRKPEAIGRTTGLKLGAYGTEREISHPVPRACDEESHRKRDFKINAKLIRKFWYSIDCPGCSAHSRGMAKQHHTTECRNKN